MIPARATRALAALAERRVLVLAAVLALAGVVWGTYTWVRDLSVFAVRHVTITGADGREGADIRRALRSAAERMTTLHVERRKLDEAVDSFRAVRSVSVSADFPNSMKIEVIEWRPVAALLARDGRRVALAGNGTLLRGVGTGARLPVVRIARIPTAGALAEPGALRLVRVLGAAPPTLTRLLARAYDTKHGIEVATREGTVLQFGDAGRPAAKWAAAARVLADPGARGADVIDVRLPGRPAARESYETPAGEASAVAGATSEATRLATAAAATGAATGTTGPSGATSGGPQP